MIGNYKRRALSHDYSAPGHYLITMVTRNRLPLFGRLVNREKPYVFQTELGRRIFSEERPKIRQIYPIVNVWRTCIMPDHIHMIVNVSDYFPDHKSIGNVVCGFKTGCNNLWHNLSPENTGGLFDEGYNDRLIYRSGQIEAWKKYLDDNPRRLLLKRKYPQLFYTTYNKPILGNTCQVFGNVFLLNMPGKMCVVVHRADSEEAFEKNHRLWMACGEHGGILVGAFISPREKDILYEAVERRMSVIQLCEHGFGRYYKPSGILFDACAQGLLLQICPNESQNRYGKISREGCLALNKFAEEIAACNDLLV